AVGGVVVAAGGAVAAFAFNAGACLLAAVILAFWRPPRESRPAGGRGGILPAIAEGLRTVRDRAPLRNVMIRSAAFTFCGSAIWALMPLVARDLVGGGPEQFGLMLGALGLGAVLGAAVSHEIRRRA